MEGNSEMVLYSAWETLIFTEIRGSSGMAGMGAREREGGGLRFIGNTWDVEGAGGGGWGVLRWSQSQGRRLASQVSRVP